MQKSMCIRSLYIANELTSINGNKINFERLCLNTIGLYDGHRMAVNREIVIRIASDIDQTESVSLPLLYIDNS